MENLNSYIERLEWRRNKVLELSSQGHSQPEIARILQIGLGTVKRFVISKTAVKAEYSQVHRRKAA